MVSLDHFLDRQKTFIVTLKSIIPEEVPTNQMQKKLWMCYYVCVQRHHPLSEIYCWKVEASTFLTLQK